MSQRIQSILIFLSAVAFGLLFFFPLAVYDGQFQILKFNIFGVSSMTPGEPSPFGTVFTLPVLILTVAVVLLSLYASTALYRSVRVNQMKKLLKLLRCNIALGIIWVAVVFLFYTNKVGQPIEGTVHYEFGIFMPMVGIVLMILSTIGIKKDINKVRSADRLR